MIMKLVKESLNDFAYIKVDKEDFKDALLDLATLDLEDEQVRYPKTNNRKKYYLDGGNNYDLYLLDRTELPISGPFEILITDNDENIIGFVRGTKHKEIISFNLIHIKENYRRLGIGSNIYKKFLDDNFIIKSDKEISDATYSLYDTLLYYDYKPIIFNDGRVGLIK